MKRLYPLFLLGVSLVLLSFFAEHLALFAVGKQARGSIYLSERSFASRHVSYWEHYEFQTADHGRGYGSYLSNRDIEGARVPVIYLEARPSINSLDVFGYRVAALLFWGGSGLAVAGLALRLWGRNSAAEGRPLAAFSFAGGAFLGLVFGGACTAYYAYAPALAPGTASDLSNDWAQQGASPNAVANDALFAFRDGWCYFNFWATNPSPVMAHRGLYRVRLEGSGTLEPIGDRDTAPELYQGINVLGDWLYFKGMDGLYRVRLNGSGAKRLLSGNVGTFLVAGERIVYQENADGGSLRILSTSGGGERRLCTEATNGFTLATDGTLYYSNKNDHGFVYTMKADGSSRARFLPQPASKLVVKGASLWYLDPKGRQLYRCNLESPEPQLIVDAPVDSYWISGQTLFYASKETLHKATLSGSEDEVLFSDPILCEFFLHEDHIVYAKWDNSGPLHIRNLTTGAETRIPR